MIRRFIKVNDQLYRGSAPTPEDVVNLHKHFKINKIISLDEKSGVKIGRICKILGIKHIMIPIEVEHAHIMTNLKRLESINLWDLLMVDGPTYVHCSHGKDRTGMLIAMFKCKYMGAPCNEAIKEAKSIGFGFGLPPFVYKLYTNMICKSCQKDHNHDKANISHIDENVVDDIVENARPEGDMADSVLDSADMTSIAPYLDPTGGPYPDYRTDYEKTPLLVGIGPNIGTGFVEV